MTTGRDPAATDADRVARARLARNATADVLARLRSTAGGETPAVPRSRAAPGPAPRADVPAPRRDANAVRAELQARILDDLADRSLLDTDEATVEAAVREFVATVLVEEDLPLNAAERARLADDLVEETLGVGPLAPLMADPAVTDILVNGPHRIYVERHGRLEPSAVRFRDDDHLVRVIERMAARVGRRIDQSSPMVDLRLADGSRVNATLPPVSLDHPTLSIRRFGRRRLRRQDLEAKGMMSQAVARFLGAAVAGRLNVLISGGTGAGKSTLLGALAESIPADERVITIEDTAELVLDQPHVVRLETRPPNLEGTGRITARDLVTNALRMRPSRLIVGEVRAGESLDMLQAMNTGHDGGMTTIHANSPRDALARMETLVLMAGLDLPSRAIREQIVAAIDLIVHVERMEDGVRRVTSVAELVGMEGETPLTQELFRFERTGVQRGRVQGRFVARGIVPRSLERLVARGLDVGVELFRNEEPGRDG